MHRNRFGELVLESAEEIDGRVFIDSGAGVSTYPADGVEDEHAVLSHDWAIGPERPVEPFARRQVRDITNVVTGEELTLDVEYDFGHEE